MTEPLTERDTRPRRPGRPRQVGPSDSYIERQAEIITESLADPSLDVDALVAALPPLPDLDPLADPDALSIS